MTPAIIHIDCEKDFRGGQQQALYLHKGMLDRGIKTHLFCREKGKFCDILTDVNHTELPLKNEIDIFSANKIAKFAKNNNYNIIISHSSHALSIGLLAAMLYTKLKVIAIRRVDFNLSNNYLSRKKYNSKHLKKIVCISDAIKEIMLNNNINENKLTVIKSGIDLYRLKGGNSQKIKDELCLRDNFIIGTIASFADHKDYPNLLNAISLVVKKYKKVKFLLVGDGELKEKCEDMADNLNILRYIHFLGYREDIADIINTFDLFVMPSKMEGLGTSVLDAMSVGLPVVSTDAGGITEAVLNGNNGIVVQKQNPEQLSYAILKLINDKDLRTDYSHNSLELVKKFDINITIDKYLKLTKCILND